MKRLFNSLYSVKSVLIITTYSFNGETQPFFSASSIVTLSQTDAYFLINASLPSSLSRVPVRPKSNLYLITSKILTKCSLGTPCISSIINKSTTCGVLIAELIISILQLLNRLFSTNFSNHWSFKTSVGTTIKTKISWFFLTNKLIISIANLVLSAEASACFNYRATTGF